MAFTKIASAGIGSTELVTLHSLNVLNNANIDGVLTYEDVTNVDSVGLITARNGIVVGSGITLSKDGDGFFTGVTTATTFVGALTGNVTGNISGGTVAGSTGTFSGAISGTTGTFTGDVTVSSANLILGDSNGSNNVIVLGASNDLQISHVSNVSKIRGVTTNDIHIESAADFKIKHTDTDGSNAEDMIVCTGDGAVELYQDNIKKLETDGNGITVTGRVLATGTSNIGFAGIDNVKLSLGTNDDFQLYHTGDNSIITAGGAGDLQIISTFDDIEIKAADNIFIRPQGGEEGIKVMGDGAVELYNNGTKRFETHSEGTYHYGHSTFIIADEGESAQLILHADEGDDDPDKWKLAAAQSTGGALYLQNYASGSWESNLIAYGDGKIELYHANSKKFETADGGIDISGWVRPTVDDYWDIGHPSYRWDDIRATNSSIVTSDRNEKEDITDTDLGLEFVNKLTPVAFKRKGKTRTHYGLIAQDVETVITDLGKTNTQFAPLIKDTLKDGSERYGLRYTELISPLVKAIQELSAKVAALEGS